MPNSIGSVTCLIDSNSVVMMPEERANGTG